MKHKVSELEGALLDMAVAKAEGWPVDKSRIPVNEIYQPSTDGRDGITIIERERMSLLPHESSEHWSASLPRRLKGERDYKFFIAAPTLLIAAMRAYVWSKFGEEVELP